MNEAEKAKELLNDFIKSKEAFKVINIKLSENTLFEAIETILQELVNKDKTIATYRNNQEDLNYAIIQVLIFGPTKENKKE